jgi:hypothetical protein
MVNAVELNAEHDDKCILKQHTLSKLVANILASIYGAQTQAQYRCQASLPQSIGTRLGCNESIYFGNLL